MCIYRVMVMVGPCSPPPPWGCGWVWGGCLVGPCCPPPVGVGGCGVGAFSPPAPAGADAAPNGKGDAPKGKGADVPFAWSTCPVNEMCQEHLVYGKGRVDSYWGAKAKAMAEATPRNDVLHFFAIFWVWTFVSRHC
jgi:hypothetical protein